MNRLFYKRMIQLNKLRACFEEFFSKHALSFCSFIKIISINLTKHYSKAALIKHTASLWVNN